VRDGVAFTRPPVVVGGVGGSGTRLIAQMLAASGYYLGTDLNEASDNLWFTLLFKRPDILGCSNEEFADLCDIFLAGMSGRGEFTAGQRERVRQLAENGRPQHDPTWLRGRGTTLLSHESSPNANDRWGWKEPNTHVVLGRLCGAFPGMKFILVARHGLDMAVSGNQNQPRLWGQLLMGKPFVATPRYSLRYWCFVHRRAMAIGAAMGDRFLFLNYDELCRDKSRWLVKLRSFLGVGEASDDELSFDLINPPTSIGRYRLHRRDEFDEDDIAYVESLGFHVQGFGGSESLSK
jgi:hypothetical protein